MNQVIAKLDLTIRLASKAKEAKLGKNKNFLPKAEAAAEKLFSISEVIQFRFQLLQLSPFVSSSLTKKYLGQKQTHLLSWGHIQRQ